MIAPPAPPVQGEGGWADGSGDEPERPPRAKKKPRGQRSLLQRDVLPEGVPWHSDELESWTAVDALAVITALLAFFAPLALLDGLRPEWEGTPDVTAGIIRVTGALLIVELGVVWALLLRELVMTWRRQRRTRRRHIPALLHDLTAHGLAAGLGGIALLYCAQLGSLATSDPLAFGLYRFRALRLEGGVSPLLMLLLACGAVVVTVVWHLDRRKLLDDPERGPFEAAAALLRAGVGASPRDLGPWAHAFRSAARGVVRVRQNLNVRLRVSTRSAAGFALALVLAAGVAYLFGNLSFRTVEDIVLPGVITLGPQWAEGGVGGLLAGWLPGTVPAGPAMPTVLLWLGLVAGFVSIIACVSHLLAAWRPFRDTLGCLAETPLAPAFDRLPARMRTMGRLHLFDPPAPQLGRGLAEAGHEALWAEARERARRGEQGFVDLLARLPGGAPPVEGRDDPPRRRLALLHLARALRTGWERRPDLVWSAGSSADRTSQDPPAADADDPAFGAWLQHAEDVAAVEATCHVEWVLRNLRRQALLLLFVILFTTAYLEAFPFPYHSMLTTLFVILVVVGVGAVVMLMGQLSRDDVLSRINGTDPGRISWDRGSLVGAALFVALPVLALLGTEVTPVGQTLFGWVEDLLRILSNV